MKKFTWGHGIALALGCFIGFIFYISFFIFPNGNNSELVSDNYYQDELEYQKVIDAKKCRPTVSKTILHNYLTE
jgi:hypothetical protein